MEFYTESVKSKKVIVNLPMAKSDDGRHWVDLDVFLTSIIKAEKKEFNKLTKHIPKSYFKTIERKDKKVKYIDRMAIGMIVSQVNNYEAWKFTVARTNNKIDKYYPMLLCESLSAMNNKLGNISFLRNELGNADKARNDFLHDNENIDDLPSKEKVVFFDNLHELQVERRKIKTNLDILTTVKNFFDKHNIKGTDVTDMFNHINGLVNLSSKKIYNARATTTEAKKFLGSKVD